MTPHFSQQSHGEKKPKKNKPNKQEKINETLENAQSCIGPITHRNKLKSKTANQRQPCDVNRKSDKQPTWAPWSIHATYSSLLRKPASMYFLGEKLLGGKTTACP